MMCLVLTWGQSFVLIKIFPMIIESYGLHVSIYIFSAFCFAGLLYTIFCIEETKGKSLSDIEKSFKRTK